MLCRRIRGTMNDELGSVRDMTIFATYFSMIIRKVHSLWYSWWYILACIWMFFLFNKFSCSYEVSAIFFSIFQYVKLTFESRKVFHSTFMLFQIVNFFPESLNRTEVPVKTTKHNVNTVLYEANLLTIIWIRKSSHPSHQGPDGNSQSSLNCFEMVQL